MQDAEPPIDYESAYSRLPSNVMLPRVKKNVEKSMTFKNKYHFNEWKKLFETEHANAIISDGFWYVICKVFKKSAPAKKDTTVALAISAGAVDQFGQVVSYEAYQEFLLDRIAANYVSFTILDDDELEQFQAMGSQPTTPESPLKPEKGEKPPRKEPHMDLQQRQGVRRKFFEQFYDIIAQSVFYSLFFAYPKSRG